MATDRESSAAVKGGAPPEATQVSDGLVASLVDVDVAFKSPGTEDINLAVRDVSMSVKPGESLVLVGRSGCGKTTVLNLLAGLLTPTRGQVSVLGRAPIEARSHIAYMFARDALLPWRSARRNVEFALELRRPELRRRARRERAQTFLDMLGVGQ